MSFCQKNSIASFGRKDIIDLVELEKLKVEGTISICICICICIWKMNDGNLFLHMVEFPEVTWQ